MLIIGFLQGPRSLHDPHLDASGFVLPRDNLPSNGFGQPSIFTRGVVSAKTSERRNAPAAISKSILPWLATTAESEAWSDLRNRGRFHRRPVDSIGIASAASKTK
jgi:hypothetical protein